MSDSIDIKGGGLFQIAEPEAPSKRKRKPGRAIGIDLGTTHSLVAIAPAGAAPHVLLDEHGEALLPSVVSYAETPPIIGKAARAVAVEHPEQVLSSIKRFMGRAPKDITFSHPYRLADDEQVVRIDVAAPGQPPRYVTPVEVSARILEALRERAEDELIGDIAGAVITVPAYFDDAQRQATKDAGRIAGLEVYRLLAEPTAAALAYGLDRQGRGEHGEGLFAIYDLGGGTFDISILRLRDGVFRVLATGGDSALGGDDFDRALAGHLLELAGLTAPDPAQLQEVMQAARAVKEALSDSEQTNVALSRCGLAETAVTRAQLEQLIRPLVSRTIRSCKATLKDAGVDRRELDGVVLVGGSTRVPLVRAEVARAFEREPLADIDPDKVVAYGAAIQADILSGSPREGVTLLDVVPLSLGLETMGGIVEKIIPRNATIPIAARQVFTNYSEKQTGMTMHVVQGERELAQDCRSLARFELRGIPRLPPSMARVEVTFELDADALLTVTARELMTGVKQAIEVKPTYGLGADEVEELIMDSLDHAREDFEARNLAQARVELGRVVLAVQTALAEVGDIPGLLDAAESAGSGRGPEREAIDAALVECEVAMTEAGHADPVNAARERLERLSEPFARRRMERALRAGMTGRTLAEIESTLAEEQQLAARRGAHAAELIDEP
jgi:molecular chaperone HscA